jgi:hypothetical protein
MTKPKTRVDVERSPDGDWPPPPADHPYGPGRREPAPSIGISLLDARHMFDCLLAYARREGRAGSN